MVKYVIEFRVIKSDRYDVPLYLIPIERIVVDDFKEYKEVERYICDLLNIDPYNFRLENIYKKNIRPDSASKGV